MNIFKKFLSMALCVGLLGAARQAEASGKKWGVALMSMGAVVSLPSLCVGACKVSAYLKSKKVLESYRKNRDKRIEISESIKADNIQNGAEYFEERSSMIPLCRATEKNFRKNEKKEVEMVNFFESKRFFFPVFTGLSLLGIGYGVYTEK